MKVSTAKISSVVLALLSAGWGLNQASAEENKEIVIGAALGLSGWLEAVDAPALKMIELWADQTNAAGGLLGRKIKVISLDTKSDKVEAAKAGEQLIEQNVDLLFGPGDYDFGAPAALQAQRAGKISVLAPVEDAKDGPVGIGPFAFSGANAVQLDGAVIGDWGYNRKGLRRGYTLLDTSGEYQKSNCAGYEWGFKKAGGEIVGGDTFRYDDPSIAVQITKLQDAITNKQVDHLMLCSHFLAAGAVRQIRAAGINIPIFGPGGFFGTSWSKGIPNLTDFYVPMFSLVADDPRPEVVALANAYKAKFGEVPPAQWSYPAYSFLQLWAKAVQKANTVDAKPVADVLSTFKDEPTVIGPRSFTPKIHMQIDMPMMITEHTDGQQKFVEEWRIKEPVPEAVLFRVKPN